MIGTFPKAVNPRRSMNQGQVAATASTTQIAVARSTRSAIVVTNLDGSNPVFVGETPALSSDYQLEAGKSITLDAKGRIDAITGGGTINVTFADSYLGDG